MAKMKAHICSRSQIVLIPYDKSLKILKLLWYSPKI